MAAPTDAGYGETVELDKGAVTGLGLSAEDPIGFDEKNGSEAEEEVQVAKKPRVEKTSENGAPDAVAADDVDDAGFGVEEFPAKDDAELAPLLAHNGASADSEERINGEGDDEDDSENGGLGAAEDDEPADDATAVASSKDAPAAGDVGLRTLLQEGDTTKTSSLLNGGTEDASHLLNGAK